MVEYVTEPHSKESEESVLGSMLLSKSACAAAIEHLSPGDFYTNSHQLLFGFLSEFYSKGTPLDPVVVTSTLEKLGKLDDVGGKAYVYSLMGTVPNPLNIEHYAARVKEEALARSLMRTGYELVELGRKSHVPIETRLAEGEAKVYGIGAASRKEAVASLADKTDEVYHAMLEARLVGATISGIPTPWERVNQITGGLNSGEMVVVGARSSMGKTAFILDILLHAALEGRTVLLFSLEMSRREIVARLLCNLGNVDLWRFKNYPAALTNNELNRLDEARHTLNGLDFFVDDRADRSLTEISSIARRRARGNTPIVAIDYIQLMYGSTRSDSRTQEMAKIANEIKVLARELDCPVIVSSQLRKKAQGQPKEPSLEDLKETSAIEQACDIGILLYRPEVDDSDASVKGKAEIFIAKNRNGRIGRCELTWVGSLTSFRDSMDWN